MKFRLLLIALSLAGCREHRPPVPTADEANQLNEMDDALNGLSARTTKKGRRIAPPALSMLLAEGRHGNEFRDVGPVSFAAAVRPFGESFTS